MVKARRGYADGPFGQVHFADSGGDGIPLILSHQSPQSLRQFDTVTPELNKRGLRTIAVDTPGFGESDVTDFVPNLEDWARAFPPVLDRLGLPSAHFAGHHTGAQIVNAVALQFPARVQSVIMHSPNPTTAEERATGLAGVEKYERNFVYEPDGSHLARNFQLRWSMYGAGGDPKLTTRVIAEKFIGRGPFWYGHFASYNYDQATALKRLKHRALIITNTGDVIYKQALEARRLRPDFAFVELPGGTIDILDQQPAEWAEAVAAFIKYAQGD